MVPSGQLWQNLDTKYRYTSTVLKEVTLTAQESLFFSEYAEFVYTDEELN